MPPCNLMIAQYIKLQYYGITGTQIDSVIKLEPYSLIPVHKRILYNPWA
jgi:hypothetical protein